MRGAKIKIAFVAILGAAVLLRLLSLQYNFFPHGNVDENMRAAVSFASEGTLRTAPSSDEPYWYSTKEFGGKYLDLNAPLWPVIAGSILAAAGFFEIELPVFSVFRALSFFFGLAIIILGWLLMRRLAVLVGIAEDAGKTAALAVSAFLAFSYILADYSGNGHFYAAQAVFYLLWSLAALGGSRFKFPLLGALSAVGWLLNYQAIVMIAATTALAFFEKKSAFLRIRNFLAAVLIFFAVASPLLIRNAAVFGSPLHTTRINLESYVFKKAGFEPERRGDVLYYDLDAGDYLAIIKGSLAEWLPHNVYYAFRKLFVLAPVILVFFMYAFADYVFVPRRLAAVFPVAVLLFFHFLQAASWPIFQFRYFVPVLPLVYILGTEYLFRVFSRPGRNVVLALAFVALIAVGIEMYLSNPLHVCYYDCALTTGPFGRNEELNHLIANGLIK